MNVYIFEPSPGWDYCGGMAVAVASDFQRAVELLNAKAKDKDSSDHKFYERLEDVLDLKALAYTDGKGWYEVPVKDARAESYEADQGWDVWVLSGLVPCIDQPETAWMNFNFA